MSESHPPLRPLGPVLLLDRFAPLQAKLIALLRGLAPGDWQRPTACALWSVKDIVAHLLDDDLRRLSSDRDGLPPDKDGLGDYASLVAWINRMNAQWVAAARRLSPRVLVDLLEVTGPEVVELFRSRDPFAPAHWAVAWAGETESPHWFDVGRDYTERWLHQQQIREAVGAPLLTGAEWLGPVLDLFVRAVPMALRGVMRAPGTAVHVAITGEAGGDWTVRRGEAGWELLAGAASAAAASVRLSDDTAWRLFSKGLPPDAARERSRIEGDQMLGTAVLGALAIMA
jgi:uncharacterized protein (TIGR03083 family)